MDGRTVRFSYASRFIDLNVDLDKGQIAASDKILIATKILPYINYFCEFSTKSVLEYVLYLLRPPPVGSRKKDWSPGASVAKLL